MYNFNRADWPSIKSELDSVNWASAMDSIEPQISWMNFKIILNSIIIINITISIFMYYY